MLRIKVPISPEGWDEEKQEFVEPTYKTLDLEHSLVSISKWESIWCKAFFSKHQKTSEEIIDYIKCMTITPNVEDEVYACLTQTNISQINKYIEAPMTATHVNDVKNGKTGRETVTSELIYYWMIALNIPWECENWHINRLLTLVRVCNVKNQPAKKMSARDVISRNAALNAARRQQLNSKG